MQCALHVAGQSVVPAGGALLQHVGVVQVLGCHL
jgi:hypothetical protein